jgi:hypothetical protein
MFELRIGISQNLILYDSCIKSDQSQMIRDLNFRKALGISGRHKTSTPLISIISPACISVQVTSFRV